MVFQLPSRLGIDTVCFSYKMKRLKLHFCSLYEAVLQNELALFGRTCSMLARTNGESSLWMSYHINNSYFVCFPINWMCTKYC